MSRLPALPRIRLGRYQHYKGHYHQVLGVVRHSETLEPLVLYEHLGARPSQWVRPYKMFIGSVMIKGKRQPRFRFIQR